MKQIIITTLLLTLAVAMLAVGGHALFVENNWVKGGLSLATGGAACYLAFTGRAND